MCVHNWTTHPALRMKTGQGWDHSQTPPWCSKVCRYVHVLTCKGCVWGGFIPHAAGQWGHHCWHCLYYTHRSECVWVKLGETFRCRSFFPCSLLVNVLQWSAAQVPYTAAMRVRCVLYASYASCSYRDTGCSYCTWVCFNLECSFSGHWESLSEGGWLFPMKTCSSFLCQPLAQHLFKHEFVLLSFFCPYCTISFHLLQKCLLPLLPVCFQLHSVEERRMLAVVCTELCPLEAQFYFARSMGN